MHGSTRGGASVQFWAAMSSVDQAARDAAIRRNLHHLYTHQSQPNPKPIPHTTVTRGFEAVAFPKIVSSSLCIGQLLHAAR